MQNFFVSESTSVLTQDAFIVAEAMLRSRQHSTLPSSFVDCQGKCAKRRRIPKPTTTASLNCSAYMYMVTIYRQPATHYCPMRNTRKALTHFSLSLAKHLANVPRLCHHKPESHRTLRYQGIYPGS